MDSVFIRSEGLYLQWYLVKFYLQSSTDVSASGPRFSDYEAPSPHSLRSPTRAHGTLYESNDEKLVQSSSLPPAVSSLHSQALGDFLYSSSGDGSPNIITYVQIGALSTRYRQTVTIFSTNFETTRRRPFGGNNLSVCDKFPANH